MTHHPFLTPSPYEADAGHLIGRDPRDIASVESNPARLRCEAARNAEAAQ